MHAVVIVIHLMIVMAMIAFVLLQKSEGGGLGMGSSGGFLSSRGTANVLTRTTAFLAVAFFATSLLLSIIAGLNRKPSSIIPSAVPSPTPGAPAAPTEGGLLDQLRGPPQAPVQQQVPGPQVPQAQ